MQFTTAIENVVVLMMENHSFDNMLGRWSDDISGNEMNASREGVAYYTGPSRDLPWRTNPGPAHDFDSVSQQVFGPVLGDLPNMSGFVLNYQDKLSSKYPDLQLGAVMGCYPAQQLPVITTLASSFTTCTRWFCSVPGPTGPNRIYANCATSGGYAGPAFMTKAQAEKQPPTPESIQKSLGATLPSEWGSLTSIFGVLADNGYSWGVYHEDANFAVEMALDVVREGYGGTACVDPLFGKTFLQQLWNNTLPHYCFLTPDLWQNSQHPQDDIRFGECLIANVYEMIANSSYWDKTLLIITYDEHGGFYDWVPTPIVVPNPDDKNWDQLTWPNDPDLHAPFYFDRLGVRVPALLISPYVAAGLDSTQYEHSSIVATVLELFGLTWPVPNRRLNSGTNTVNTFKNAIGSVPRTDVPLRLPRPPASDDYAPLPIPVFPAQPPSAGQHH
jgi:phospholipase C